MTAADENFGPLRAYFLDLLVGIGRVVLFSSFSQRFNLITVMSLITLSNEVLLDHICTFLEIPDLYRLMHSCSRFSVVLSDANKLWKKKFKERWPKICFCDQQENEVNWLDRMNLRLRIRRIVKEEVRSMLPLCYPESPETYTPESVIHTLTTGDYPYLEFVDDELTQLKFNPSKELADDLTFSYFVNHLYTKVRMCLLEKKWLNFMALPESQKSLFEGALLVSEWINMDFRENHDPSDCELMFDWIVERVKFLLGETRNYHRGVDVQPTERETLTTISRVLFDKEEMKFLIIYVDDDVEVRNHFVACGCFCPGTYSADVVLLSDTRICHNNILCVIYQEVAKRMGILCEPIFCYKDHRFYKRVVLRWKEYPEQEEGYTYIDLYRKGTLQRLDTTRRLGPLYDYFDDEVYYDVDLYSPIATVEQVFQEMLRLLLEQEDRRMCHLSHGYTKPYWVYPTSNLMRLVCAISPLSTDLIRTYAKFCERRRIQFGDAFRLCEARRISCTKLRKLLTEHKSKLEEQFVVSYRSPSVKYAVGLVMIYKDDAKCYLRKRACVITSWDIKCKGNYCGMYEKPVANLDQPFYNILVHEGRSKYVPEEKLELHRNPESTTVKNWELGMHFVKFDDRIYVPNSMSKSRFPDDEAFARSLGGRN